MSKEPNYYHVVVAYIGADNRPHNQDVITYGHTPQEAAEMARGVVMECIAGARPVAGACTLIGDIGEAAAYAAMLADGQREPDEPTARATHAAPSALQ